MEEVLGTGHFTRLEVDECLHLLRTHDVGRVAWETEAGPIILPVTYTCHDKVIVFRTTPESPLAELIEEREIAFQIDSFDVETRVGWSVLARGRSWTPTSPDELVELWSHDKPEPWAPGERNLFICLEPEVLTGRALAAED